MDWVVFGNVAGQFLIDNFSVVVGVLCGSLFAVKRKLDIVGVISLGIVTGYGGGVIRDILLHDQGFFIMDNPELILICIVLGSIVSIFRKQLMGLEAHLFHVDAFSMALFALAGSSKAWAAGTGVVITILLGGITAVGGGVLRDISTGETPSVFQSSNFYAVSGVAGSAAYVALSVCGLPTPVPDIACVATAFALTALSARFGWRTTGG